ncbi:hypothetical protein COO91_03716 [Nostoc flagelliforme CCNUN1]|uniref:Uncharacterized protein n=1 Tax=Nostoc flagelliforme CCNUN1 TaxID=2038116 RepID=A0A2K8SQQ8_9NOSO|nr:hypothetical protein COO91_03716 [Nostoc flagelliforme CCNUN1]
MKKLGDRGQGENSSPLPVSNDQFPMPTCLERIAKAKAPLTRSVSDTVGESVTNT